MIDATMVGYVLLALATILGLFMTIGRPIIKATVTMAELVLTVKNLTAHVNKIESIHSSYERDNQKSHSRIWDKLDDHDRKFVEIDTQLTK